jgi:chemotaxis protein MotB
MRTYVALATVAIIGLTLTSGCVPKAEYDKALAACRRANEELLKSKEQLQLAQSENEQFASKLAISGQSMGSKQSEIQLLESRYADMDKSFRELEALYRKTQEGGAPPPIGPLVLLPAPVDEALRGFAQDNAELTEYLPKYGMVKFKADFTFEKGSDDVSAGAVDALGKLAEILNSEAAKAFHVYVAGHTDDIPIKKPETRRRHPTNWYLSAHRAVEVQKVLVKNGLEPGRIGVMGFGEYHPVEPNLPNQKGNPKNRRVEIWIVPPDRFLTKTAEPEAKE